VSTASKWVAQVKQQGIEGSLMEESQMKDWSFCALNPNTSKSSNISSSGDKTLQPVQDGLKDLSPLPDVHLTSRLHEST